MLPYYNLYAEVPSAKKKYLVTNIYSENRKEIEVSNTNQFHGNTK